MEGERRLISRRPLDTRSLRGRDSAMMTNRAAWLGVGLAVATLAATSLAGPALGEESAGRRGALVDQIIITQEPDVGKVAGLIETGSHHVFAQGVGNPTVYQRLRN